MDAENVSGLEYFVLSNKALQSPLNEKRDKVIDFWRSEWAKVFDEIDPNFDLNLSQLLSQSRVTFLEWDGEIVALQTLTDHKILDFCEDPYFKYYTIEFFQFLQKKGIEKFQSMQNLIVAQELSGLKSKINLPAILLGLNFRHTELYGLDATIGLGRKDNTSLNTAKKFNMYQVGEDISMHNVPVGQLVCEDVTNHPKRNVQFHIEELWGESTFFKTISLKDN